MELQYKQQTLHNNFMGASYASGGLQGHTWEFQWGPQGLEQAIKRVGMNPVITQNFSTDPMGRILSMTYNGPTYGGELFFHYDVQGNTSLLTDSNGQAVASFRYDLHSGKLVEHWNPSNLELVNLKNARQGSVTLTSAIGYLPDWGIDLTVQPWRPIIARNDWGFINVRHDSTEPGDDDEDDEKDCGEDPCENEDLLNYGMRFSRQRFYEFYPLITRHIFSYCPINGFQYHGIQYLLFVHTITEEAQDIFRDKGFSDEHISRISEKMGDCFSRHGPTAYCFPVLCPDGSCGIECECLGETFDSCV